MAEKFGRLTRNSLLVALLHNLLFGGKAKVSSSVGPLTNRRAPLETVTVGQFEYAFDVVL